MSNGIIPKALLNHKLYTKPEFQGPRSPAHSISSGSPSPQTRLRSTSPVHSTPSTIDLSFVPVKLQLPSIIPTKVDIAQDIKSNATTHRRKVKMSVKIRISKRLQNGIENLKEFLEKLNWIYKREHRADKPASDTKKAEYISEI